MRRPEFITNVLFAAGLTLAGAFGGAAKSEAAPPDPNNCRVMQNSEKQVIIICPYSYRPEAAIEMVKERCLVTGIKRDGSKRVSITRLTTALQKNCWDLPAKIYVRTIFKNPPKIPPHRRP